MRNNLSVLAPRTRFWLPLLAVGLIATLLVSYPAPASAAEDGLGIFRTACSDSFLKQVDPIVNPGPPGTLSGHMHEFAANNSTDSDSTYASMTAAGTTCELSADTAGYWVPALVGPNGDFVQMEKMTAYYTNRPHLPDGRDTVPFPPDFRMIAAADYPHSYWNCVGDSDHSMDGRLDSPPNCGSDGLRLHIFFPSCWDGVNIDSADHMSHVAYGYREGSVYGDPGATEDYRIDACPATHPIKIPQVRYRIVYPVSNGSEHKLSDGEVLGHADFWNTWDQDVLEALTHQVLNAGVDGSAINDGNLDQFIDPGATPPPSNTGTFADTTNDTHEANIEKIADAGITLGCDTNGRLFCPEGFVTRGQMASFLARAFNLPAAQRDHFADDRGSTHEDNINRISEAGITTGTADGTYQPDDLVTRAQMGSFIARAMKLDPIQTERFVDVSGVHEGNINAIANAGVTLGCTSDGTRYCPDEFVKRNQMASFLARALGL